MRWQSTENNDDITDIHFHPSRHNHLLSGGIDGLVSIFDTDVQDEDDSLLQVVNHGPIHKAGFLSDEVVFALSHDEQFSIHAVTRDAECTTPFAGSLSESANPITSDIPPVHFGDLRPILHCDYVIDVLQVDGNAFVATGIHTRYVKSMSLLKGLAGLKDHECTRRMQPDILMANVLP
jgi:WD repeat-containing protein 89